MTDAPFVRRVALLVAAALAVGTVVWAIGQLRPGLDGELARDGGRAIELRYDVAAGLERSLAGLGRRLEGQPGITATRVEPAGADRLPWLVVEGGGTPGNGFLPPETGPDGSRRWRPTPDRAENLRKRGFNALAERLDRRLDHLPTGRGRVALPAHGRMRLELTKDVPDAWLGPVLAPGALTLHAGQVAVDGFDILGATLVEGGLRLGLAERARARLEGAGSAFEVRVDGRPVARGPATTDGQPTLPLLADAPRAELAMWLDSGPLPMPVAVAGEKAIVPTR